MYDILITILLSLGVIFLIYKFYSKIDSLLKTYLPTQRVIDIKSEMRSIDTIQTTDKAIELDSKIDDLYQKIDHIVFMPIEFIKKFILSITSKIG